MSKVRNITGEQYEILKLLQSGNFEMWCQKGFSRYPHLYIRLANGEVVKKNGASMIWLLNKNLIELDHYEDEKRGNRIGVSYESKKVPFYRGTDFLKNLPIFPDMRI